MCKCPYEPTSGLKLQVGIQIILVVVSNWELKTKGFERKKKKSEVGRFILHMRTITRGRIRLREPGEWSKSSPSPSLSHPMHPNLNDPSLG